MNFTVAPVPGGLAPLGREASQGLAPRFSVAAKPRGSDAGRSGSAPLTAKLPVAPEKTVTGVMALTVGPGPQDA